MCRRILPALAAAAALFLPGRLDAAADLPQGARTIRISEVNAVAVYTRGDRDSATGGTTTVTVRIQPNESRFAAVGLLEEFVGGAGDQWKAASWIAAFVASEAAGDASLSDREYLVKVRGHIDGPSAGMLLASSMLACLRGDTILQNVTVTGTVNPDGTIGPVDGIIQKIEGAKAAGLVKFGYPAGTVTSRDLRTGKEVDVAEFAKKTGIEAVPVADLQDAYLILTGNPLTRPQALPESGVTPPPELVAKIEKAARDAAAEIVARLPDLEAEIAKAPDSARRGLAQRLNQLRDNVVADPGKLEGSEQVAEYYSRIVRLDMLSGLVETQIRIAAPNLALEELLATARAKRRLDADDIRSAALRISEIVTAQIAASDSRLGEAHDTLHRALADTTVGGVVDLLHGYLTWWEARTKLECARASVADLRESAAAPLPDKDTDGKSVHDLRRQRIELLQLVAGRATAYLASVKPMARNAANWTVFSSRQGEKAKLDKEFFREMAHAYTCAAAAGIAYCDSLIEADHTEGNGAAISQFERRLRAMDPEYAQIRRIALEAGYEPSDNGKADAFTYIEQMGSGLFAYLVAAERTNRYYNYRAVHNDTGAIARFENAGALAIALDEARRRTLEDCAALKSGVGFIPDSITINYQLSGALRGLDDAEARFAALSMYWRCHQIARLSLSLQTHILQ